MKSPFHFSPALPVVRVAKLATVATAAAMLLLVAGCGQKGPLYLPKPPAAHPVRTAPADAAADNAADQAGAKSAPVAPAK